MPVLRTHDKDVALALSAQTIRAAQFSGDVVSIADGDTVTVLDATRTQHRVRLAGIDAPEKKQPFGTRSRQNLAELVFREHVIVDWSKRDRYGRIVGKILVGGQDASLAQIRAGLAWHYKAYQKEQSPVDRTAYAAAEVQARQSRVGLWQDPNPVPPWDWRRERRRKRAR